MQLINDLNIYKENLCNRKLKVHIRHKQVVERHNILCVNHTLFYQEQYEIMYKASPIIQETTEKLEQNEILAEDGDIQ